MIHFCVNNFIKPIIMAAVVYLFLCIILCSATNNNLFDTLITTVPNDKELSLEYFHFNQSESHSEPYNDTQCYGELGCLSNEGWFFVSRPFNQLPESREVIATRFLLYTRKNPNSPQSLVVGDMPGISKSNFDFSVPTKCIVHGFFQNAYLDWVQDMLFELLKHSNFNVIVVDWSGGAGFPYIKAVNNARIVGKEIALLLNFLKDNFGLNPKDCHLIGHSLGAHICGYAGEKLRNLGRISGLDPAEMFFQDTEPKVHLDYTDALFVDVIHTNSKATKLTGFGMYQPIGHLDFYPNGGNTQPGCEQGLMDYLFTEGLSEGFQYYLACNHRRARIYFLESINSNCSFLAFACDSYESFKQGLCTSCGEDNSKCAQMGFYANKYKLNNHRLVSFYLDTGDSKPFCTYHYLIEIKFDSKPNLSVQYGKIFIHLYGEENHDPVELKIESISIVHGQTYSFMQTHRKRLKSIKEMAFYWQYKSIFYDPFSWKVFRKPVIYIKTIRIFELSQQYSVQFCDLNEKIFPKAVYFFNKTECDQQLSTQHQSTENVNISTNIPESTTVLKNTEVTNEITTSDPEIMDDIEHEVRSIEFYK